MIEVQAQPWSVVPLRPLVSEREPASELEDAAPTYHGSDLAEIIHGYAVNLFGREYIAVGETEVWMIQEVIGIGSKFDIHAFAEAKALTKTQVHIHELRPT